MDDTELGSWARAVTTADGFWQIPGFHSPNGTAVVVNYLTGALLAYGHLSMRGDNPGIFPSLLLDLGGRGEARKRQRPP